MAQSAFGLPSLFDPSIATDQAALDRQMAIAQALRQQALSPVETSGRQIGGMGYAISPWEGIAKLVQAYAASSKDKETDAARQQLSQKSVAALAAALRGDVPGQTQTGPALPAPSAPNAVAPPIPEGSPPMQSTPQSFQAQQAQQQQQPQQQGGNQFTLANLLRGSALEQFGGAPAASAFWKNFETPEAIRTLLAKGQDPAAVGGLETRKLQREVDQPTTLGRTAFWSPKTGIQGLPAQIAGSVAVPDSNVPGGFRYEQSPGGAGAIEQEAKSGALGRAAGVPAENAVDVHGNPVPARSVADVLRQAPTQIPPAVQAARDDTRVAILKQELANEPDPKNRALIQTELDAMGGGKASSPSGGVYLKPPLGTENAQKGLDTSWEQLKQASREANNTKSYLQNIVTAAEKGAITGPNADRREMIAGFLQLAGVKEKVNENAIDQKKLLDKYANQIVTRLGQGGLGTDAARSMLEAAYPNSSMNVGAIREAAANLGGAQEMVKAKARFLLDPATKRDSAEYQKRELMFDQNADPRIFQGLEIRDPDKRKAFIQESLQQDPGFLDRVRKLKELGAIQ